MVPDQLLLLAAFCDGSIGVGAWRTWSAGRPLEAAHPTEARLFSSVYRNLREGGVAEEEIPAAVKRAARSTFIRTRLLVREAMVTSSLLATTGIDSLLLKGAGLVAGGYHEAGVRPMSDFDLLVRYDDVGAASAVMSANGWVPEATVTNAVLESRHAIVFRRGESTCDLHWWALWESRAAHADARFWSDAERIAFDGMTACILRPEHQLIHTIVHGSRAFDPSGVRWIGDALAVLATRGRGFDWTLLLAEVEARRIEYPVVEALAYLAEGFGATVPDEVIAALRVRRVPIGQRSMYSARPSQRPPTWYAFLFASGYIWIHGLHGMGLRTRLLWLPRNLQQAFALEKMRHLPLEIARRSGRKFGSVFKPLESERGA